MKWMVQKQNNKQKPVRYGSSHLQSQYSAEAGGLSLSKILSQNGLKIPNKNPDTKMFFPFGPHPSQQFYYILKAHFP